MKKTELKTIALKGEDSRLQFKSNVRNVDALAAEMVAFSNSEGGHWEVLRSLPARDSPQCLRRTAGTRITGKQGSNKVDQ